MAFVAPTQNLPIARLHARQPIAFFDEFSDRIGARPAFLIPDGDEVGDRFAVSGKDDGFAVLHVSQQLCEMGLGFGCLNFSHHN